MKRLALSLLLVIISAIVGLGWGIDQWYAGQNNAEENASINAYKTVGRELAILIDQQGVQIEWDDWFAFSNLHPQVFPYAEFPLPENLKKNFEQGEALLLESGDQLSLNFYLASQNQVLSLMLPDELRDGPNFWLSSGLTLLFYSGVIAVVLLWLYPLLRRLLILQRAAQNFGAGNLQARIATEKSSYIYTIEQEFNRMAQRIEQLIDDNKLLARGLSHDLRTPLARLRFGLDVLAEAEASPSQQQQLAHLHRDLSAMEALVEALLNYARFDQAQVKFEPIPLNLAEFVKALHGDFYNDQVKLFIDPAAHSSRILAQPDYLAMLVHNLVDNALRYGAGQIHVSVYANNRQWVLCVEDNGPGIAPEERAKVIKPFYRATTVTSAYAVTAAHAAIVTGTASVTNPTPLTNPANGHGLGLALVDRITQWHSAQLVLENSLDLGGLRVQIIFSPQPD